MKKKTTALLAALLIAAVPTVTLFSSCDKEPALDDEILGTDEKSEFSPNIPEGTTFDGETFNILIGSVGGVMYAEEENSDLINDTVYRTNKLVEEHFGIKLNIEKTGSAATGAGQSEATARFRSLIESGDETYHAFTHVQHTGMPEMILEKFFVDWNTIPYINLDDPWWYSNITNDLCFGDKVYVMTGDYINYVDSICCLVFNKDIFDDLGLEYPYQDVLDGTWTFDKFTDLVEKGAKDLDGDGIMNVENDQYGLVGWGYELAPALLVSSGYSPLDRDADNMPVLNQNTADAHDIYQKIVDMFADGQTAWAGFQGNEWATQYHAFTQGRAMFQDVFLSNLSSYKEVEFDFGIIPYPKWGEDAEYMNRSSNMTALTYIPVTNTNLELTGAVLEELAYQGYYNLTPSYFDQVLTIKSTRDVESEDMLPIIKDNARFLYDGYAPSIIDAVQQKANNYTSAYASNLPTYQKDLEDMRELLGAE